MYLKMAGLLLFLALALCCPAAAAYSAYGWGFAAGPRGLFGVQQGALDSLDAADMLSQPNYGWQAGAYHLNGDGGWDGNTGFYAIDYRAPLTSGDTKMWMIYFWALPGTALGNISVAWGVIGGHLPLNMAAQLALIQKPQGVTGGPDVGMEWTTPPVMTLPFYSTSNGLTGYGFKFTLTMVPEPSSLLALVGGLAGFAGIALRRRRA